LLVTLAQGGQSAVTEPRLMRTPAIHGDTIVFSYAGDLWVTKTGSGAIARRLTSHPALEIRPKISQDGKWVAFNGSYDGTPEIYVVSIDGGEPKRLTYDPAAENTLGWTPDGRVAYSSTDGSFTARQPQLWYASPDGGLPSPTPIKEIAELTFLPGGKSIAYNRLNSYAFNWRRYRGGTQGRISFYNFDTNSYSELPSGREQSYFPMSVRNSVYFISDKNEGTLNLYKYDMASRQTTQITKYNDSDVRWPETDGKSIVWERDGFLWVYDTETGETVKQAPKILSENLSARPQLRELADQIGGFSLSPSGARLAIEARGELFSVPSGDGDTRNYTQTSGVREMSPDWSPDGKSIAFLSDKTGNVEVYTMPQLGGDAVQMTNAQGTVPFNSVAWSPDSKMLIMGTESSDLYLVDVATKKLTRIAKGDYGMGATDWSPDSKWVAITMPGKNLLGSLYLYEVATNKLHRITDGHYDDRNVAFDQNGKYLYLTSLRTFSPSFGAYEFSLKVDNGERVYVLPLANDTANPLTEPNEEEPDGPPQRPSGPPPGAGGPPSPASVKIDIAGLGARALPLPVPPGSYPAIFGTNNGVLYVRVAGLPTLVKYDIASRESQTIYGGPMGGISFNPTRTKMAIGAGGGISVLDVRPGANPAQGRVNLSSVEAVIDPKQEWHEIFWNAWRYQRDNFYNAAFVTGPEWLAIGKKYEGYLQYVQHRSDLNYVLGQMIGELGTGHAYVGGGDYGTMPPGVPVGSLGVDYAVVGNNVQLRHIYRGENFDESRRGPLGEPGIDVKDGEYLLEIDGHPVNRNVTPGSLLINKVGKYVTLTVNTTPTMAGARKVRVRPLSSDINLRYAEWTEANRQKVAAASGGRIGYMHIPNTQLEGAVEFIRGYYSQTDKDAMIVDERWNGGGYIQPWFVDTLARKMRAGIQERNTKDVADAMAIEGPKALLINEYAGSGGDFFPWMFRQAKVGPLIGKRTWGGLVGIQGQYPFVDGGWMSSPEFAIYDRETGNIIAENTGIDPDIDVDARPDLIAKGQDPQLDAAIKYLMEQLKKMPPKKDRANLPTVGPLGRVKRG
jgi:tricorn protease